jgi:hypothetical protein
VGFVVSEFVYLDIRNIIYTNIKKMAYNAEQFGSVLGKFLHTASFHCTEEYFSRTTESFFFFFALYVIGFIHGYASVSCFGLEPCIWWVI